MLLAIYCSFESTVMNAYIYILYIGFTNRLSFFLTIYIYYQFTGVPNHYTYCNILLFSTMYIHILVFVLLASNLPPVRPTDAASWRSRTRTAVMREGRTERSDFWPLDFDLERSVGVGKWSKTLRTGLAAIFRKGGQRPKPEKNQGMYRHICLHWHGWLIFMINPSKSNMNWMGMGISYHGFGSPVITILKKK